MKFTSEDLMKAMGLQVGDRIRFEDEIYTIKKLNTEKNCYIYAVEEKEKEKLLIHYLVDLDFEILTKLKRVGEMKCKEFECSNCPMKMICMHNIPLRDSEYTLYDMLKELEINIAYSDFFDQEIYNLLKVRLDKEVVEC